MVNVIGVRFQNAGKLYFFDPGPYWPTPGDFVIVETARGIEFGEVVTPVREISDEQLSAPLKQVVRIATAQDVQHAQDNKRSEKEAYAICQKKIGEHKLDMKLVSVEYTFDNSKILFYFTANGRVDFRSLVKDLAAVFKTRIELRQIGVRDEAKMLGGLGPCGRSVCCGSFLGDFQPVSIKMAKEQNLSLNPTKISGVCGRLMCCLKYEQDNYEQTRKRMPKVGKEVMTPDGVGVVWDLNIIKETVRVRIQKGDSSELKDYPVEDVQRLGGAPAAPRPAQEEAPAQNAEAIEPPAQDDAPAEPSQDSTPEKSARPPREKRGDRPRGKDRQLGKPVQRENPNRRQEGDAPRPERKPRPEKPAQPEKASPSAPAGAPVKEVPGAVSARPAPRVSPWKQAVEAALRAAKSDEAAPQSPASLEDHQETYQPTRVGDEDDIL